MRIDCKVKKSSIGHNHNINIFMIIKRLKKREKINLLNFLRKHCSIVIKTNKIKE